MKTYLDLYRVVLGGIKEPADIAIYLDRDADGVEVAMQVLRSKLYELEIEKRRQGAAELEATKQDISFGSQIRNYVMHPYRLVKDTRTKYEQTNVEAVLDGEIDEFIKEFLHFKKTGKVLGTDGD